MSHFQGRQIRSSLCREEYRSRWMGLDKHLGKTRHQARDNNLYIGRPSYKDAPLTPRRQSTSVRPLTARLATFIVHARQPEPCQICRPGPSLSASMHHRCGAGVSCDADGSGLAGLAPLTRAPISSPLLLQTS